MVIRWPAAAAAIHRQFSRLSPLGRSERAVKLYRTYSGQAAEARRLAETAMNADARQYWENVARLWGRKADGIFDSAFSDKKRDMRE